MTTEDIIKKHKAKRKNYVDYSSPKSMPSNIKYLKGLITRSLLTIIFVLLSIIYTNLGTDNKKLYKKYVLEDSLKFTKINNLYQDLFGKVDVISPNNEAEAVFFNSMEFTKMENYKNSTKLTIGRMQNVNVITSGIVVFIGDKDDLGNTVIIQGNDGIDIWYSNITDIDISLYDYVERGSIIGTSNTEDIYLTIDSDGTYLSYEEYLKKD